MQQVGMSVDGFEKFTSNVTPMKQLSLSFLKMFASGPTAAKNSYQRVPAQNLLITLTLN